MNITRAQENETLDDLTPEDVFSRCMEIYDIPEEDQGKLKELYAEVVRSLSEDDMNAE